MRELRRRYRQWRINAQIARLNHPRDCYGCHQLWDVCRNCNRHHNPDRTCSEMRMFAEMKAKI